MKRYFINMCQKKKLTSFGVILVISMASIFSIYAQSSILQDVDPVFKTRILLIYDASNSMNARWQSDSKMLISQNLMMNILDTLSQIKNLELALRVYGHQSSFPPLDCKDTRLEVPFAANNVKQIAHKIKSLVPKGSTPIAYSLEQAANDFSPCSNCRNIIILITDGLEECGGDPCAASAYLQS
ncbi:MAG: VWA domain-containing protein, partial [Bacteroidales bacterium]